MCALLVFGRGKPAAAAEVADARKLLATGKYGDCVEVARQAMRDGAVSLPWRQALIEALLALGQVDKAVAELGAIEFRFADNLAALWLRHEVMRAAGQPAAAKDLLVRIRTLSTLPGIRLTDPEELVAAGQAALLLGDEAKAILKTYFEPAVAKDPNFRRGYLAAGALALGKHDDQLAATWFRRGLKRLAGDADLHAGLAQAFLASDRKEMLAEIAAALKVNPNLAAALLLRARHEIDAEDFNAADKTLKRVFAVDAGQPQAWAFTAVLSHLSGDAPGEARARQQALLRAPTSPGVDWLIGSQLSQKYRFAEGAAAQRRALKIDPGYVPAKIQLAQDLLRLGNTAEGWALAEAVHNEDGYDVTAYNLVMLRDHMQKFAVIKESGFVVHMEAREAAIYGDEVVALLSEARRALDAKYGFVAQRPVEIEIFPDQVDFAVRTFGTPGGAGYLGVCFGNVITANSPSGNVGATANWKAVLWHEYTHVVTLGLTHNKMPRWLSEGISVFEESQRDKSWGQQMTPRHRDLIAEGALTPLAQLSGAFLNPKTPEHLMFAYFQSALVVQWVVTQYGFGALLGIVRDIGHGKSVATALEAHTAPIDGAQRAFTEFAKKLSAAVPTGAAMLKFEQEAQAALHDEQWVRARGVAEKWRAAYPEQKGPDNAYLALALASRKLNDGDGEWAALNTLAAHSSDAAAAYVRLMEMAEAKGDAEALGTQALRFAAVNPMAASVWQALGRAREAKRDSGGAVVAYRKLLQLSPSDPADVHFRLAKLLRDKDPRAARRSVLEALAAAPRFRQAHRLLLEMRGGR